MAYRLRDELILEPDEYDGQGMTLVGDVLIKGDRWTLRGVRIEGTLTVEGDDVTLRDVYAEGDSCLILNGDGVTVEDSKFVGTDTALQVHGDGTVIRNCEIQSECTGLLINGDGAIVRQCSISTKDDAGYGIYADNTANALICLSVIGGAERSVVMEGADNCAVIMNSAVSVYAGLSSNIYVIDNALGGRLSAVRSRYLIFDGNACHELVLGVTRYRNGDNITDTDVRAEVGANEALLPHTNKDLFVGMERQTTVCDGLSFTDYIKSCLETDGVVMIPPGAYSVDEDLVLEGIEGKKIYAYGVLEEFTDYPFGNKFTDCDGLDVNGITIGYSKQSSGQVYVLLSPEGTNEIKTVTAAGYINDFGTTNLDVFFMNTQEADVYRAGAPNSHTSIAYRTASKLSDGTISMMLDSDKYGIEAGDVICCRLAHGSYTTIHLDTCTDVHFRDMVTYGTADGICLAAIGKSSGLSAERWHNTARSAPVIDEETYERYAALEKRYGVDLEISIDGEGRYRGSVPRIGSIDATHINGTESGFDVKSSIFESMCDDGSNQRGYSSRLHDVVIREDGVTELYYKNNMPEWYALHSELPAGLGCEPFEIGENILVYTPEGDTFCDTEVLSAAEYVETVNYTIDGVERECHSPIYKVTVDSDAVNADALFDENGELRFDLSENHYRMDNKVIVDNLSRVSAGFTFDNVLVQNIRSRGLCIKTTDATVKNCTFRNLGNGLLLHFESEWGESTVARDVLVKDCLFENTGYLYGDYEELRYAPISIMGPETETLGERVPCRNIVIEGCRFNETAHKYHIVIRNAAGITVRDNDFGYIWDYEYEELCAPYASVSVGNARDVKISGNTCPDGIEMSDWVKVTDSVGVTVE